MTPAPRAARRAALVLATVAFVLAVRVGLEPRPGSPSAPLPPEGRVRAAEALAASALDRAALLDDLARRRVLLIGESHFLVEPQRFAADLLADLRERDGRAAVLLLELPPGLQEHLDAYLASGDEAALDDGWSEHADALPYQPLVRWARGHPEIVSRVIAFDESAAHVFLMQALLTDTRNATMAAAVAHAARAHPELRVVAYGGQLHMMNAGRWLYDSPSRAPVGARLGALGLPASDVAAVWLLAGAPPAGAVWAEPGAVKLTGAAGDLPVATLARDAIHGVTRLGELADFVVFLGSTTTRIARGAPAP